MVGAEVAECGKVFTEMQFIFMDYIDAELRRRLSTWRFLSCVSRVTCFKELLICHIKRVWRNIFPVECREL